MGPDASGGGGTTRPTPSATKRNSAIRKEQNRNASRIYRERRKQRLALLDRLLEKDQDQAFPASSQESAPAEPASSQPENVQTVSSLTPSDGPSATPLVQLPSSEPLGEVVEAEVPSAFDSLSFDGTWPLSSNDPIWNFAVEQDGTSGMAQPRPELPTLAPSPSSILGCAGQDSSCSDDGVLQGGKRSQNRDFSAAMAFGSTGTFFYTPGQRSMYLLEPSSSPESDKGKAVASKAASLSSSSRLSTTLVPSSRSAASTPCPLPGEESLGEFMDHLMKLRPPNAKRIIYVQQHGLFAAVLDNTLAIGVLDGPKGVFADEANSPFNRDWIDSKGSMELAQIRSKFSAAPKDLQPVDVQITVEHHVYLDVIPFPSFRERTLKALACDPPLFDEDELCYDICNLEGLIVWGSQGNNQGMDACRPWDMRCWEPKPWFLRKYHFLVGGWEDEMWRAARWWHAMRNEKIAAGPFNIIVKMDDSQGLAIAFEEAKQSYSEGGIPIGAALVSKDGKLLGRGHNMRVQLGSAIHHGETSALYNSGRLPARAYQGSTMYTTLSPCDMCTGACLLYGIARVVIGENANFIGGEAYLRSRGVEVVVVSDAGCKELMDKFIAEKPDLWNEDIGVEERVYSKE
ncbi:hypothetical protein N8I77_004288 [Diaporthe amygdali]|uniref:Cytosine deaminase n=1 Tax=Phomopsis amygdali TaxID=1214568 RepID=A0AAD9W5T3_PHOAM|nr:hypothetical protein N8I77_004288 [Diaporthe amygdali]